MKEVIALFIVIALAVFLFGGNAINVGNPFDNTAETRIEADAAIRVAEVDASKTQMWVMASPILLGILVGGAVVLLVINWQGRIYFERARSQRQILPGQPEFYSALREVALSQGKQIVVKNGTYYLVTQEGQRQPVAALTMGD